MSNFLCIHITAPVWRTKGINNTFKSFFSVLIPWQELQFLLLISSQMWTESNSIQ